MNPVLSYAVVAGGTAQVFTVSPTGTLDFEGGFDEAEAMKRAALAASYPLELGAELRPQEDRGDDLYLGGCPRPRVFVYGEAPDRAPLPRPEVDGFMRRYPSVAKALVDGDDRLVSILAQRSRKLRPFLRLVGHIAGGRAALGFALHWLCEKDSCKEASLAALLGGENREDLPYARAFNLARPSIKARLVEEYRAEASRLILDGLDQGSRLVLPIAGSEFRPCLAKLAALIAEARTRARLASIIEGADAGAADRHIDAYLASAALILRPEPYNKADRNAVGVWLKLPETEADEQAGYLPRDLAAILGPELAEGLELEAELYRLSEWGAELRLASRFSAHFSGNGIILPPS